MAQDQRYGRRTRYDRDDERERDRDYGGGGDSRRSEPRSYRSGPYGEDNSGSRFEHDRRQDRDFQGTMRSGGYGRFEEEEDFGTGRRFTGGSESGREYGDSDFGSRSGSGDRSGGYAGYRNRDQGSGSRYGSREAGYTNAGSGNYSQGGGYEGGGFGSYKQDFERKYGAGPYGSGNRSGGYRGYQRDERNAGSDNERGWWDRATDEVSSWFGDRDAERRREVDQQHRGRGPKNYTRSDDRIRDDVSDRLTDDPLVDASDIDVTVQSQEVTLTGTVSTRNEKRLAEDCAESVSGVKHVQNNLRVKTQQSWGSTGTGSGGNTGTGYTSGSSTGTSSTTGGSSDLRSTFGSSGTTTM